MIPVIHEFHQGPSRDLFKKYTEPRFPLDMAVTHAIVTGVLNDGQMEREFLDRLGAVLQTYRDR